MQFEAYASNRLAAREQIRDALNWYCRAIDRRQYHWLFKAFHEGGVIRSGAYHGDIAGFPALLAERHTRVPRAAHMMGNILFDFIDDAHAFVESYCLAVEEFVPEDGQGALNRVVRIRYADEFEMRAGVWKIAKRAIVVDHAMAPQPVGEAGFFKGPMGTRDINDPVLQQRIALGLAD